MTSLSKLAAVALALVATSAAAQPVPSGRDVLLRALRVTGADSVAPRHRSLKMSGRFASPNMEFGGAITSVRTSTGEFRWVMHVAGYGRIENGYADSTGYSINEKTGTELLSGAQLAQVGAQAVWLDTPDNYVSMLNAGVVTFDGKAAYRLELMSKDSLRITRFFDVATGLPLGRATRLTTPEGQVEVQQIMGDYRDVGGMLIPTTLRQVGGSGQVVTFDTIEWDVAAPAEYALPKVVLQMKQMGLTRIDPQ